MARRLVSLGSSRYIGRSMRFNRGVGEQVMEAFQKMMEQSEADSDASPPPAKKTKKLPSEVRVVCMDCMLCHGVDTIGIVSG